MAQNRNLIDERGPDAARAWILRSIRNFEGNDWTVSTPKHPCCARMDDEAANAIDDINQIV